MQTFDDVTVSRISYKLSYNVLSFRSVVKLPEDFEDRYEYFAKSLAFKFHRNKDLQERVEEHSCTFVYIFSLLNTFSNCFELCVFVLPPLVPLKDGTKVFVLQVEIRERDNF